MEKLLAGLATFSIIALIGGYILERDVLQNTIDLQKMTFFGLLAGSAAGAFFVFLLRKKLDSWPPKIAVGLLVAFFGPLVLSIFNRLGVEKKANETFIFEHEQGRLASLGIQKTTSIRPNQFILTVQRSGQTIRLKHRKHALFPLTKAGDDVLLPVQKGRFGFDVVRLED